MKDEQSLAKYADEIITQYWPSFLETNESFDPTSLDQESETKVQTFVKGFLIAIMNSELKPLSQITGKDIQVAINMIENGIPAEEKYDSLFEEFMMVGRFFLGWLSKNKIIGLTDDQIEDAFRDALSVPESFEGDSNYLDSDRETYHYDRPGLPEYQESEARKISFKVGAIVEAFIKAGGLTNILEQEDDIVEDEMALGITALAMHMYGEYRLTPTQWTRAALKHILKNYFVKDVLIYPENFHYLIPTLKAFFAYAATAELIHPEQVQPLTKAIDEVAPLLIRLGTKENHFSEAKRVALSMSREVEGMSDDEFDDYLSYDQNGDPIGNITTDDGSSKSISLDEWQKKQSKRKKKKKKKK